LPTLYVIVSKTVNEFILCVFECFVRFFCVILCALERVSAGFKSDPDHHAGRIAEIGISNSTYHFAIEDENHLQRDRLIREALVRLAFRNI